MSRPKKTSDDAIERAMEILDRNCPGPSEDPEAWMDVADVRRDLQRRLDQRRARRAGISVAYLRKCRREDSE